MSTIHFENGDLKFKGCDPGAVQYGNFINYYQFHPPASRINLLPNNLWGTKQSKFIGLDIGCNSGDLTESLYEFLKSSKNKEHLNLLGVDIDPVLIERANEKNKYVDGIQYRQLDFMDVEQCNSVLNCYLEHFNELKFSAIFCFSITMWIHLNHGDNGLRQFLTDISKMTNMIIIEPQPWKCYKTAVKRMKRSNHDFPEYKNLQVRNNVENVIEHILCECDFIKVVESTQTEWNRTIKVFRRKM